MYEIVFTPEYNRRAGKFFRKHADLISQYEKVLGLLELDPFHPSLRLHKLLGKLSELHSVSINIHYRLTVEFLVHGKTITPVDVGSHDEAYR
jgi:toxin HigB-1